MVVHLKKLAVGIESVDHIREVQKQRLQDNVDQEGNHYLFTYTRNTPKRKEEILAGGCLYWIIKGQYRVRQAIIGFEEGVDEEGRKYCLILLDSELTETETVPHKAFQGWRYLTPQDAPKDLDGRAAEAAQALPDDLAGELRDLGLL